MASLQIVEKEPSQLSQEEWLQFVEILRAHNEILIPSDKVESSNISATTDNFTAQTQDMTLEVRLNFGLPTVSTSPILGGGVCSGSAKEAKFDGLIAFDTLSALKQTIMISVEKGAGGVYAEFTNGKGKVVGKFSCVNAEEGDGLKIKGGFSFY